MQEEYNIITSFSFLQFYDIKIWRKKLNSKQKFTINVKYNKDELINWLYFNSYIILEFFKNIIDAE